MKMKLIGMGIAGAALLAGCAGTLPPTGSMQSSMANIRAAEEVGAANVPQAKLHLQLAQEQSAHAKALMAKEENERAGFLLMRAEADGELAVALAHESAARAEAEAAIEKLNAPQD